MLNKNSLSRCWLLISIRFEIVARSALTVLWLSVCLSSNAAVTVFESAGATPGSITPTRDAFRAAIGGGTIEGSDGDFGGLRREINWDYAVDFYSDPNPMPPKVSSVRGVIPLQSGTGFLLSSTVASGQPILFGFPGDLQAFSGERLFSQTNGSYLDIKFVVPGTFSVATGTFTSGTTSAFGIVFVDVEDNSATNYTSMEFFDASGGLIFSRTVLAAGNRGLSFLGASFDAGERISRVRINTTPGNPLLGHGQRLNEVSDFVVMDDFIYATPAATVPEPDTWALLLGGLVAIGYMRKKKQRSQSAG